MRLLVSRTQQFPWNSLFLNTELRHCLGEAELETPRSQIPELYTLSVMEDGHMTSVELDPIRQNGTQS